MKRYFMLIVVLVVVLFSLPLAAKAMDWYSSPIKVAWDAVTTYTSGEMIDQTDTSLSVKYVAVVKDLQNNQIDTIATGVEALEVQIIYAQKGRYAVGIYTELHDADTQHVYTSDYAWSDVVECVKDGQTFAIKNVGNPNKPSKLRMLFDTVAKAMTFWK